MKILLLAGFFVLTINFANAGPGASRMATPEKIQSISRSLGVAKRIYDKYSHRYSHIQKRSFHTKLKTEGFKPKEASATPQRHTLLPLPKKVEYLDNTYEIFRTPSNFRSNIEESVKRAHAEQSLSINGEKKK